MGFIEIIKRASHNEIIAEWFRNLFSDEIEETEGTISNEKIWLLGSESIEEAESHNSNIVNLLEYKRALQEMLEQLPA